MRKIALISAILAGTLFAAFYTVPAQAQAATRTWVSGVGDDANPCSRTAPCKTWAGAISKTLAGGEIDALDPGGFGAVTITKAITLDGGGGQVASTLVAGTNGINVAAGPNDIVIIRNMRINGLEQSGSPGLSGISFTSGAVLTVDKCDVFGFSTAGINISSAATGSVNVYNTTFRTIQGTGIIATTSAGVVFVEISNSNFQGMLNGGVLTGNGVNAGNGIVMTVSNSVFNGLATAAQATGTGNLSLDSSVFSTNSVGVGSSTGMINANNNSFYNNTTAFSVTGSSTSPGNNKVVGTLGTFSPSPMTQK
jgi:hypothetical protein